MVSKKQVNILLISSMILTADIGAQTFTDYIPAGFHTPFLKKGEFILSGEVFHQNNKRTLLSKSENLSSTADKSLETIVSFGGFLGLTDQFTVGYSLLVFPKQTVAKGAQQNEANFHLNPNFTVAYRLSENFELFGQSLYDLRKNVLGDREIIIFAPISFDPNTGEVIIEETTIVQPAAFDLEFRDFSVRVGFVWRGRF